MKEASLDDLQEVLPAQVAHDLYLRLHQEEAGENQ